jgi:hypothetical protein
LFVIEEVTLHGLLRRSPDKSHEVLSEMFCAAQILAIQQFWAKSVLWSLRSPYWVRDFSAVGAKTWV